MRKLALLLTSILFVPSMSRADSLLSVPGLADAIANGAKASKAIGVADINGKLSAGGFLPIRQLHDSEGINYLAFGPGGLIKQGEHMKGGAVLAADTSAIVRKLESKSAWYQAHVSKVTLPDFWIGPAILPPLDSSFTWKDWKSWMGISLSVGF